MPDITPQQAAAIRDTVQDPVAFVSKWLGMDCWSKQKQALELLNEPASSTVIKSCHSSGKTRICAAAVLWWLARWDDCIVVTTAPTWVQVTNLLWGEIHALVGMSKYPYPEPNKTELRLVTKEKKKRYAFGLSTSVTEQNEGVRFQGVHAEHVLIVVDEAPGVNPKIWSAIDGIRAGGDVRVLAPGNPTIPSGPFVDAFAPGNFTGWNPITISAFDTPNFEGIYLQYYDAIKGREVVLGDRSGKDLLSLNQKDLLSNPRPYLTTKAWVKEKYYTWGPGHYLWDSRVMGNFPSQSEDSLISTTWIEQAETSEKEAVGLIHVGIDVAGPGEDETVLAIRRGPRLLGLRAWANPDPRGEIMQELARYDRDQIGTINVDSAGIGWGMFTHLRDTYKEKVVPINVGESPSNSKAAEKYSNLKAELYWSLRARFESGEISAEKDVLDPVVKKQLASIRYGPNPKGKTEIESKKDASKRGVKSPDRAEAIMLAYGDVNQMIFGALQVIRENGVMEQTSKEMAKVAMSTMTKPMTAPLTAECPECHSKAIVNVAGHQHCNQCGADWGGKALVLEAQSRGQYLKGR